MASANLLLLWEFLSRHGFWLLLLLLLATAISRRYWTPLRKYPGPFLASVSRLWKVLDVASARTNLNSVELHRKYGSLVRIAPNELSVSSPKMASEILAPGKGFIKTDFYTLFPPQEPKDIFTETNDHIHARKKRVAGVPYNLKSIISSSDALVNTTRLLISKIDDGAEKQEVVDLGKWLHLFAFDSLGKMAFSTEFGLLEAGFDIGNTLNMIKKAARYSTIVGQVPFWDRFLMNNPMLKYLPLPRSNILVASRALKAVQSRHPFTESKASSFNDILSHLIAGHLKAPLAFTEDDVSAVAIGAIFAGSDSTASTMQSFFFLILKHRRVYNKIVDEILEQQKSGELTVDLMTYSEAQRLHYFQAALMESMRLRPAVGVNISRSAPKDGVTLDGHYFSSATRFAINPWVVHRDKNVFGDDAEEYRPERWVEGDPEKIRLMKKYMVQFGGGSHVCLGRNLALVEMNRLLPQLIREFEMELVDPDLELTTEAWFFVLQSGLQVRLRKRGVPVE